MTNVSTKLIERAGDEAFKGRKRAIIDAWRTWYHSIIKAMAAQLKHEGVGNDDLVSGEITALQDELDHCREVGHVLFGFMCDGDGDHGDD